MDSVNIVAEWFFAGFTRVTEIDTDEEERSEVYNVSGKSCLVFARIQNRALTRHQWVRRTPTLEGIVVNKHRPKHNFTERDLNCVRLKLWSRDDLIFIPERYWVQTTFIIHVYCWTGARIGAFFMDGLWYKVRFRHSRLTNSLSDYLQDVLILQRVDGRRWRLIYKID